uniref:Uncharacterized protein LOC100378465 n=1 Tax=Saccoglossus kowalevskii TaxID=10224 RepID=A0ABM0M7T4_SACKO|nr:PREDICTED: uncharacterized protein LOC100378465 [Saccoglossus kowalevskii]
MTSQQKQWSCSCSLILVLAVILSGAGLVNSTSTLPRRSLSQRGHCRYAGTHGNTIGCCYGWKRNRVGQCEPICRKPCLHGTCTGANRCTCNKGYTGPTCSQDVNECGNNVCQHRCMNTVGSYRCYCRYGYLLLADERSCRADNQCKLDRCHYGCMSGPLGYQCLCPSGMQIGTDGKTCIDVDECSTMRSPCPRRRRCLNTFGSYMCLCDVGYSFQYVNGKLRCRDDNECELNTHQCSPDASCINNVGSYRCFCKDGYVGDGRLCYSIDPRRCEDNPCSPLVWCTDVNYKANSVENVVENGLIKLYECGQCPFGYTGSGETCAKTDVSVTVVVVDKAEPEVPIEGAYIKLLAPEETDRTVTYSDGISTFNGLVTLVAPTDSVVIVTAAREGYMGSSMTYFALADQKNVITVYMEPPSRDNTIEFEYDVRRSRALEFPFRGDVFYEYILPEGSLNVADGKRVTAVFTRVDLPVDMMDGSPELVAMVTEISNEATDAGLQRRNLEAFGMAVLKFYDSDTDLPVTLKAPMTISMPLSESVSVVGGDIPGWFYDEFEGVWYQDGSGQVNSRGDGFNTWSYQTSRTTWIAAANPWSTQTHCVQVHVCYDENCNQPVPNSAVW